MAAQIKKYDPNQYNFGDFAKTMNQNFAIERAQNGQGGAFGVNAGVNPANPVNLGGTTNSQTLGNLGANGVGAVGVNAGGVGNLSSVNTVGQAKPLAGRDVFRGITNSFFDTLKANGVGTSMTYSSPLVPKTPEFSPTVQAGEGDVPESVIQVGEAIKNGYGYVNRNEYNRFELTDSNVDAVSEYLRERGFAESDIQEYLKNKNKLVYDYSYRENAGNNIGGAAVGGEPQLSQGGQVAQSGGTLSFEDWQSAYSIDPTVEYQNAQAQLDYEFKTWMSEYGARAEQLYQMGLSNSGVSDIYGANAYTAYVQASMDLKRAEITQQAENKRAYQEYLDGIEAQQSAVTSAAFNSYAGSYTPAQEQSVRVALAAQGLSAEQVENAIAQLNNYYNSLPEDQRPDVVAGNAKVNEAFQSLAASYATDTAADKDQRIRNMYAAMGWSQSEIGKLIDMLNGFAGVSGVSANDTLIKALAKEYEAMFKNGYTGSAEDIVNVRQMIEASENAQYADQIIAQMNENLAANKDASAKDELEDINEIDINKLTVADVDAHIDTISKTYGEESDQYEQLRSAIATKLTLGYKQALASPDESASFLGVTDDTIIAEANGKEITWAKADNEARAFYIISSLTDQYKSGVISELGYVETMSDYIKEDTKMQSDNLGNYIDTYYFIDDLDVPANVQESLTKALVESVTLKSTYVYTHDDATGKYKTVNISNKNKQGGVQYPLVVSNVSDNENAALNKAFNQGQDIYELGGEIYVCVHAANNAKTFYKVDQHASEDYVLGMYSAKRTEKLKAEQKAFFDIVKQYAHLYRSDGYGIENVLYGDRQSTGAEGLEDYMKNRLGIGK